MIISKNQSREHQRQCAFPGCSNRFVGPAQRKYCDDQRCVDARKILAQKTRKPKQDTSADNMRLVKGQFKPGTMLRIQCAACGPSGRCQEKFMVVYEANRDIYPKYCERHRNAYQRQRFEGKLNAQSTTE
jgi:hypothetical protein